MTPSAATTSAATSAMGTPPAVAPGARSALHRDGSLVLPGLLTPGACRRLRDHLAPLLLPEGRDPFRSRHTRRVYGVLHNTRAADALLDHPAVLALLDRLLLPNFLLSQLDVVERAPGAAARLGPTTTTTPSPAPARPCRSPRRGPSTRAPSSPCGRAATAGPPPAAPPDPVYPCTCRRARA
ncbi:hypothetical protein [Nonomuraea dietziae]|uniref:hypothetical protein n=1 Tax=Nonomuraea dietziae TaxID=65515 RepID=UPI00340F75EB